MTATADYVIVGAGIVGLTVAMEINQRRPDARVIVLEKEAEPGRHSSGRNSGVLHSGIYYPPMSIKAQVCGQGAREMARYCQERGLPLNPIGKILVPISKGDAAQLDMLEQRGPLNGVVVRRLDRAELARLEPEAGSATGEALLIAQTSVVSSQAVLGSVVDDVLRRGIEIRCGGMIDSVDAKERTIHWSGTTITYGHVINTAGLHADSVAHCFGVGENYTLLPFKGLYWKLDPAAGFAINHLIYPVPDLRVPFLGVHTTSAIDGTIYIGPSSVPGFGRENYRGLQDVRPRELLSILGHLTDQYLADRNGFRRLAWQEGRRYFKPWFVDAARKILPRLRPEHLLPCDKVGIRAQMLDKRNGELVNDFLIEAGPHSTHVLNAISPAFTSAFSLARRIADFADIT